MPNRRCCACIFPRRSVRCLPGSARTAVGGRRDGCPGPSNSPSSVHRQRTGSRRSAPSIPTGHKKVFPIPGGHKKSVLFQGRFPAVWTGLEPATPCVTGRYSNQLNYHTVLFADANIGIFPGTANIRAIISQLFSHFLPGRPGQNNRCGLSPPFAINRFPNTRPRRPLLRRPGSTTPPARHSRQANTKKASFFKDAFLRYGRDFNLHNQEIS